MRADGDASTMARVAAQEDSPHPAGDDGGERARALRYRAVLALKKATRVHEELVETLKAVVEDGTSLAADIPYPDDVVLFDLVTDVDQAYASMLRWFAAVEGWEKLNALVAGEEQEVAGS